MNEMIIVILLLVILIMGGHIGYTKYTEHKATEARLAQEQRARAAEERKVMVQINSKVRACVVRLRDAVWLEDFGMISGREFEDKLQDYIQENDKRIYEIEGLTTPQNSMKVNTIISYLRAGQDVLIMRIMLLESEMRVLKAKAREAPERKKALKEYADSLSDYNDVLEKFIEIAKDPETRHVSPAGCIGLE
jgi:hypothetical protein